jgi:hypothetical protein
MSRAKPLPLQPRLWSCSRSVRDGRRREQVRAERAHVRVTASAGMCCHRPRPRASRRSCSSASLPTMHRARVNARLSRAACDAMRCDAMRCAFEWHLAEWRLGWALRCLACLARRELRHRCQRCGIAASAAASLPALRHHCQRFAIAASAAPSLPWGGSISRSLTVCLTEDRRSESSFCTTSRISSRPPCFGSIPNIPHTQLRARTRAHTHNCAHARAHTHTHCAHAHAHTHRHTHTHAHTHTRTHAHAQGCMSMHAPASVVEQGAGWAGGRKYPV